MAKKSTKRKVKKALKKIHKGYIAVVILAITIGIFGGYFAAYFISGRDTLELVGEKVTLVNEGEPVIYSDEGIKYVSNGKNLSSKVVITTNMTKDTSGNYVGTPEKDCELFIIYEITEGRAAGRTLYRVFRLAENNGGEA